MKMKSIKTLNLLNLWLGNTKLVSKLNSLSVLYQMKLRELIEKLEF